MRITDTQGRTIILEKSFLETGMFGDGSDGAVTFDGTSTVLGLVPSGSTYTMNRSIFCSAITINSGVTLKSAGFKIYCTGTLTNNGTISNAGGPGGSGSGSTGGSGGSSASAAELGGSAPGGAGPTGGTASGSPGASGSSVSLGIGASGGAGGAGASGNSGSGGALGTGGAVGATRPCKTLTHHLISGVAFDLGRSGRRKRGFGRRQRLHGRWWRRRRWWRWRSTDDICGNLEQ